MLLLDALDECALRKGRNALLDVIVARFTELPAWLGLIVTTRPESDIMEKLQTGLQLGARNILDLETPENKRDVELFLRREMQGRVAPPEDFDEGMQLVLAKSGGLLLYVHYVRERIAGGNQLTLAASRSLAGASRAFMKFMPPMSMLAS